MIFLTTRPLRVLGILVVLATLLSSAGPIVVRRYVHVDRLRSNNEVAGFTFAAIGVLYAVLLAFAVIVVWEEFNRAETAVVQEAGAAEAIYRLAEGIGGVQGAALRVELAEYLTTVIDKDWPAMERGRPSPAARHALDGIYAKLLTIRPTDFHDASIQADLFRHLAVLTQERRQRVVMAAGVVPDAVWFVLFGGAVLTISFTFFFGSRSLLAQSVMTGMLSLLILGQLLVVVVIDHPFTGSVKVTPAPLAAVLEDLSKAPP